jgi:tetratricopeptide (TPR) repeat protein
VIFTADHPKSRLAKEYHALTDSIIEHNLDDREGALSFIRAATRRRGHLIASLSRSVIESRLAAIRRDHASDIDVLRTLADLRMSEGRFEDAERLWTMLVELKAVTPHVLLHRAESRAVLGNRDAAIADIERLLQDSSAADFEIGRALSVLSALAPERLPSVAGAPALQNLEVEGRLWLAEQLARDEAALSAARDIFRQLIGTPTASASLQEHARNQLTLVLMGLGQIEEALTLLNQMANRDTSVSESFNYAMARWVADGTPQRPLFEHVLSLDEDNGTANYAQCLALTHAVLDQPEAAQQHLNQARQRLASRTEPQFSCWRYRVVMPDDFLADLDGIRRFIDDRSVRPRLFDYAPSHTQ